MKTIINGIVGFMEFLPLNFLPAFMCGNIEPTNDTLALANLGSNVSLIVSRLAYSDPMVIAHEIGHNLGLRHTFIHPSYPSDNDRYDIDLVMMQTKQMGHIHISNAISFNEVVSIMKKIIINLTH